MLSNRYILCHSILLRKLMSKFSNTPDSRKNNVPDVVDTFQVLFHWFQNPTRLSNLVEGQSETTIRYPLSITHVTVFDFDSYASNSWSVSETQFYLVA